MKFSGLFWLSVVVLASRRTRAFAPTAKGSQYATRSILKPSPTADKRHVGPLKYRVLDEQDKDSDPTAIKLLARAPPNFKMQKVLEDSTARQNVARVKPNSAINTPLIKALRANQYGLLALATVVSAVILLVTQGPEVFSHLDQVLKWTGEGSGVFEFRLTPDALLLGIGSAMPMLALSNLIESSDKRVFTNLNFSTIILCMTLFGRRTLPPAEFLPPKYRSVDLPTTKNWQVLVEAFTLSSITGYCEEAIFRRQVPAVLAQIFTGNLWIPFFGQALLFGLGHMNPSQKPTENAVMVALQTINGLALGLILLLSGGQLVVPMIAHATYDFVTFFKTWNDANTQLEYAEEKYKEPLPPDVEQEVQIVLRSNPEMKDARVLNTLKRLFYTFDYDKNKSLTLSEVKKGLMYFALEKHAKSLPSEKEIERAFASTVQSRQATGVPKDRLRFPDFLRLYSSLTALQKKKLNPMKRLSHKLEEVREELVGV